ncbi:MAG: flagellar basal body L-ring protein FlgH [Deltaproteobacteria bacterium]|nr:flagellar basal body L-ring protein FlgH [Deltaproteobacteria bacterium]
MVSFRWLGAVALVTLCACGPAHIAEYTPKKRALDASPKPTPEQRVTTPGSLYRDGELAGALFVDARAFRVNDVVVVSVEEVADAERSADTDVERRSNTAIGLQAVPIIGPLVPAAATVNATAGATADGTFQGGGSTNRRDRLVATVSTVVREVLANGNLFIEGHRVVLVNNEEHHLYVSGIVRPIDIDQSNSIPSSKIAEAQIEFVGRGVVSDNQTQGVVQRFLGFLWPF